MAAKAVGTSEILLGDEWHDDTQCLPPIMGSHPIEYDAACGEHLSIQVIHRPLFWQAGAVLIDDRLTANDAHLKDTGRGRHLLQEHLTVVRIGYLPRQHEHVHTVDQTIGRLLGTRLSGTIDLRLEARLHPPHQQEEHDDQRALNDQVQLPLNA